MVRIYKNEYEDAVSISVEGKRIDFSIIKGERKMIIAEFEDGRGDPVQEIVLPLLSGIAILGSFFSDPQVMLDMIDMKPVPESQKA